MTHPAEIRFNKNIAYLQQHYPYLYNLAQNTPLRKLTLDMDDHGRVDIHSGNAYFYNGDARAFARQEAEQFNTIVAPGNAIHGLRPHGANAFKAQRYFSRSITRLYQDTQVDQTEDYQIPDFLALVAIMGIGAGFHIEELVNRREILALIIYETDPEEFVTSLYCIDWEAIFLKFSERGKSIQLVIGDFKLATDQYAVLWNQLIDHPPSFSLCTYLYNHRNQDKYRKVIKKIQKDLKVYLSLWGYYDDEINQMNNALHNFRAGNELLPLADKQAMNCPAFIIGSGPSLDDRIEDIRKYQGKAVLYSAGTALRALYKQGIKPDFHIEIESHYEPFRVISEINDPEYLQDITLICSAQTTPKIPPMFGRVMLFTKDSTAIHELSKDLTDQIRGTTPTCTNAALAICYHLNHQQVFLFGTDYGFRNTGSHHSKNSIYYSEQRSDLVKQSTNYQQQDLIEIESVDGLPMQTTMIYNASRRRLESDISYFLKNRAIEVYNCANGAKIENAEHMEQSRFCSLMESSTAKKENDLQLMSDRKRAVFSPEFLQQRTDELESNLRKIADDILNMMGSGQKTLTQHYQNLHIVGQYLSFGLSRYGALQFLIRGAIWHYLHAGASVALKLQNSPEKMAEYIERWETNFRHFINTVPDHVHNVVSKEFNDSDPWIHTAIDDPDCPEYEP